MSDTIGLLRSLTLSQPLVLLALIAALPLVLFAAHARLRHTPLGLRAAVVGIRLLVAALLVFALSQPQLRPAGHGRAVVFAVDVSDSISPDQLAWARAWVERAQAALPSGSHSNVIEFGARAQLAGANQPPPPTASTDLAAAQRLGGSVLARDGGLAPEIVLLTDGWQTSGPAAIDSLPAGVAISYVPLPQPGQPPFAVIHS